MNSIDPIQSMAVQGPLAASAADAVRESAAVAMATAATRVMDVMQLSPALAAAASGVHDIQPVASSQIDRIMALREAIANGTYETPAVLDGTAAELARALLAS